MSPLRLRNVFSNRIVALFEFKSSPQHYANFKLQKVGWDTCLKRWIVLSVEKSTPSRLQFVYQNRICPFDGGDTETHTGQLEEGLDQTYNERKRPQVLRLILV
jgi:hypothetical protein